MTSDPTFRDVSVSAWTTMDLHECPPGPPLRAYLLARRAQGYALVGLEQTARSCRLGARGVRLPARAVIVLGAEREGVPADLLPLLDLCV